MQGVLVGFFVSPDGVHVGVPVSLKGVLVGILVSTEGVLDGVPLGVRVSPEEALDGFLVLSEGVLGGLCCSPGGVGGGVEASPFRGLMVPLGEVPIASSGFVEPHSHSSGELSGIGRFRASAGAIESFQRDAFAIRERRLNSEM
jgi:hypothetical protein